MPLVTRCRALQIALCAAVAALAACSGSSADQTIDGPSWHDGWWTIDAGAPPPPPGRELGPTPSDRGASAADSSPDGPPAGSFHPRSEWETATEPVQSSCELAIKDLRYITLHWYGGAVDLDGPDDVYQDDDFAAVLRGLQSYSLSSSTADSIFYNSAVAPDGDEWELRGLDFCAVANGCADSNQEGYAVLLALPETTSTPTAEQVQGVRQVVARIRAAAASAGNADPLEVNGHRDTAAACGMTTSCPGDIIYGMIEDGAFEP